LGAIERATARDLPDLITTPDSQELPVCEASGLDTEGYLGGLLDHFCQAGTTQPAVSAFGKIVTSIAHGQYLGVDIKIEKATACRGGQGITAFTHSMLITLERCKRAPLEHSSMNDRM
jgi:hypothetical protein